MDPRSMDPTDYAQSFVDRFEPSSPGEEISKERLEKCQIVLKEIVKRWEDGK
jgi:hypothetical protein